MTGFALCLCRDKADPVETLSVHPGRKIEFFYNSNRAIPIDKSGLEYHKEHPQSKNIRFRIASMPSKWVLKPQTVGPLKKLLFSSNFGGPSPPWCCSRRHQTWYMYRTRLVDWIWNNTSLKKCSDGHCTYPKGSPVANSKRCRTQKSAIFRCLNFFSASQISKKMIICKELYP